VTKAVKRVGTQAYPRVISNLGALNDHEETQKALMMIRFMNAYARTIHERKQIIAFFSTDTYVKPQRKGPGTTMIDMPDTVRAFQPGKLVSAGKHELGTKQHLGIMYDYFTTGYANTLGWAHANTGDTMTSVMIGGLRTVMNGDFEIFAGDLVQFYW
jgi:hypothetical protein